MINKRIVEQSKSVSSQLCHSTQSHLTDEQKAKETQCHTMHAYGSDRSTAPTYKFYCSARCIILALLPSLSVGSLIQYIRKQVPIRWTLEKQQLTHRVQQSYSDTPTVHTRLPTAHYMQ